MVIRQYRYINVIWDLIISVVLCVFSGCLAPERARHGSARPALWMDLDESCTLAHKLFTFANSLWLWTESSLLHAMTHFFYLCPSEGWLLLWCRRSAEPQIFGAKPPSAPGPSSKIQLWTFTFCFWEGFYFCHFFQTRTFEHPMTLLLVIWRSICEIM